jgi:ketosteroid isomerase-like protein
VEETRTTPAVEPKLVVEGYLQAMRDRDVERCLEFFADDATLAFMNNQYQGRSAIEGWHRDRFKAEAEIVKVDAMRVKGDVVQVDVQATSKKLQQWKIPKIGGRTTFKIAGGKIKDFKMTARVYNPFEGW